MQQSWQGSLSATNSSGEASDGDLNVAGETGVEQGRRLGGTSDSALRAPALTTVCPALALGLKQQRERKEKHQVHSRATKWDPDGGFPASDKRPLSWGGSGWSPECPGLRAALQTICEGQDSGSREARGRSCGRVQGGGEHWAPAQSPALGRPRNGSPGSWPFFKFFCHTLRC